MKALTLQFLVQSPGKLGVIWNLGTKTSKIHKVTLIFQNFQKIFKNVRKNLKNSNGFLKIDKFIRSKERKGHRITCGTIFFWLFFSNFSALLLCKTFVFDFFTMVNFF